MSTSRRSVIGSLRAGAHALRVGAHRGFLLVALTLGAWSSLAAQETPAPISTAEFAARRAALARAVGDGVILVLGGLEPFPDYLPWTQSRPFFYLTGFREPEAALVLVTRGGVRRQSVFVAPKDPAREVWTGTRLGVAGTQRALGLEGRPNTELYTALDSLLASGERLLIAGDFESGPLTLSPHAQLLGMLRDRYGAERVVDITDRIATLRGVKSPAELARLRLATEISARGHLAAIALAQPGVAEYELQAAAEQVWRSEGGDGPGYGSIVGSGPNATVLHYNANTRTTQAGDLVVMDMAASFDGYSSDITRTIPVSGRFTAAQREIYEVVLAAQLAAERQIRVGGFARAMRDSATAVLRDGLTRLGLLESPTATYECTVGPRPQLCAQLSVFYMHGLGHGIGLDVHDPDQYEGTGRIGVGSAFTIEPGVYVRAGLDEVLPDTPRNRQYLARIAPALARYAGIGVRIEDDYLVTASGVERPSALVPREIDALERLLAMPRTPRDPTVTRRFEQYRSGH